MHVYLEEGNEMRKYVAVQIDGKITVHLPHTDGNYYTLCGLDGNDPHEHIDQKTVDVPDSALVDCFSCFGIFNISRKYSMADFCTEKENSERKPNEPNPM